MKTLTLLSLSALALVLSACTVTFGLEVDRRPPGGLTTSNETYRSNYEAYVDGVRTPIICADRTTLVTYGFNFSGDLRSWSSYLKGRRTGATVERATFTANSRTVDYGSNRVDVEYTIPAGLAPQSTQDAPIQPQGIEVVPKAVVTGYTELFVDINGFGEGFGFRFRGIPVVSNCG